MAWSDNAWFVPASDEFGILCKFPSGSIFYSKAPFNFFPRFASFDSVYLNFLDSDSDFWSESQ
jgi:hypothetical protein